MAKFRKRPVEIEAMQFTAESHTVLSDFHEWLMKVDPDRKCLFVEKTLVIRTLEGNMTANHGDWIIRGVKGELYPCKADIFEQTYEAVQ